MKTIKFVFPDSYHFVSLPWRAAEDLLASIKNTSPQFYQQHGFQKALEKTLLALPERYQRQMQQGEPERKLVPGSIIALPVINYEVNFKELGTEKFVMEI